MRTSAAVLALAFTPLLLAQTAPPALMVRERDSHKPLDVARVEIEAWVVGPLAETEMTITFSNPKDVEREGELYFPLPDGATVCGYGLDIEGKLVDGVVVERERGRFVYEDIVRGRIDPGLLEWVKGNTFRTHVYPIPPNGSRTISVRYVTELEDGPEGPAYRLPLNFKEKVGVLRLRIEVVQATGVPTVLAGAVPGLAFVERGEGFVAQTAAEEVALTEDIVISLPRGDGKRTVVEKAPGGETFFCVKAAARPGAQAAEPAPAPQRIIVFWDGSGSRGTGHHAREIGILKAYLAGLKQATVTVDLVVFRHKAAPAQRFTIESGQADALVKAIEAVAYDGGTNLAALAPPPQADRPDLCLLFTDGVATLGDQVPPPLGAPVYVVAAGANADRPLLERLTFSCGGGLIDLDRVSDDEAVARIGRPVEWFLGAEVREGRVSDLVPAPPHPMTGPVAILGRLEGDATALVLRFGWQGHVTRTVEVKVAAADAVEGGLLRFVWAREKVASLLAAPIPDEREVIRLGKRYGVVTPHTSLIVLESLEQYVRYGVRPPATLAEMRKAYDETMALEAPFEVAPAQVRPAPYDPHADPIYNVLIPWWYRVALWQKTYTYPPGFRYEGPKDRPVARGGVRALCGGFGEAGAGVEDPFGGGGFGDLFGGADFGTLGVGGGVEARFEVGDVTQAAAAAAGGRGFGDLFGGGPRPSEDDPPAPRIDVGGVAGRADQTPADATPREPPGAVPPGHIVPWDPAKSYLAALKAAPRDKVWSVYLVERGKHAPSPTFFLDCAEFFLARGDHERGIQVLLNLAELGLISPMRAAAYRLVELGMLDVAAKVFEELARLRPEEPQHYRDLAVILERQGRPEQAARLLHKVIAGKWEGRAAGIEITALTELNRLLAKLGPGAAKRVGLDGRLVRLLDADLRVVATWDADLADINLVLTEPSGEVCRGSHAATAIGGQLWMDFVEGYGPEEYTLRSAMEGTYEVGVTHAWQDTPRLFETVTVRVDVFTNYGRPAERHETFFLRLRENDRVTVAEVAMPGGSVRAVPEAGR